MPIRNWLGAVVCGAASLLATVAWADPETTEPTANGPAAVGPVASAQLVAPPTADVVRSRTLEWVAQRGITDKARLEEVARLLLPGDEPRTAQDLFDATMQAFCAADAETLAFVRSCQLQRPPLLPPEATLINKEDSEPASVNPFYKANLSLYYGRYLAHRQMFEESLEVLEKTAIVDVVDPASLLFYRAVCQHHLLMKSDGLATIEQLLRNTEGVPVRYATVAALMQYDLEALKDQSLDEVSRKMSDVERRLNLGRTGQKVQKKEEEIIVTLSEIIKKIEDQQGGGGGAGGQGNRSSSPANDSVVKGSTAPGKVDPKKLKNQGEWGDLPAKARAKAKDLVARQFPAHYQAAIEEFTKKEASRPANTGK